MWGRGGEREFSLSLPHPVIVDSGQGKTYRRGWETNWRGKREARRGGGERGGQGKGEKEARGEEGG